MPSVEAPKVHSISNNIVRYRTEILNYRKIRMSSHAVIVNKMLVMPFFRPEPEVFSMISTEFTDVNVWNGVLTLGRLWHKSCIDFHKQLQKKQNISYLGTLNKKGWYQETTKWTMCLYQHSRIVMIVGLVWIPMQGTWHYIKVTRQSNLVRYLPPLDRHLALVAIPWMKDSTSLR